MAKYLHLFDSENAFQSAYNGEDYEEPWVSFTSAATVQEQHVDYNKVVIWLDLTGVERPAPSDSEPILITNGPETTPTGTVLVKEPGGAIKEYTYDIDDEGGETLIFYKRETDQNEANTTGIGSYQITLYQNNWYWSCTQASQEEQNTR